MENILKFKSIEKNVEMLKNNIFWFTIIFIKNIYNMNFKHNNITILSNYYMSNTSYPQKIHI